MIRRTLITSISAIIIAGISCSGKNPEYGIKFNPFYATPDEILSGVEKQSENYYNNYILARAYSAKKEYKNALLYYTNSCYTSKYNFSIRLFPHPVYSFLDSYSSKSPYFNDSVYEIASIFYQYNEHEYVVKFTNLLKDDGSALYRDSIILKTRSLQKLTRYSDAEKELLSLSEKYSDNGSAAGIFMRLGSIYESAGKFNDAASAYLKIIRLMTDAWHDDIAVKRVLYLISEKNVKITDPQNRIAMAQSLFSSKNYNESEKFIADILKKGDNRDAALLYLKILSRKRYPESVKFLKQYENKPEYPEFAIAHANKLWENGSKYAAVQIYSKIADTSDSDIADRVLTRLSFYYEERSNPLLVKYMEMYRKLFPDSTQSGRFTWLMGRYYLKSGNHSNAAVYFNQGIKKYPDNPYTGNCRYWLFRINHPKNPAAENEILKLLQDLAFYNPDSSHTVSLLSGYAEKLDSSRINELYKKAAKEGDEKLVHLYHTLLFMKEGYNSAYGERFSDIDSFLKDKYKAFNAFFEGASYKSSYGSNFNNMDKYFAAGDTESLNREISILPEKDSTVMTDLALAMSRYSLKYNHFNYSTFYAFKLLSLMEIQENLSLLSQNFAEALYPPAFRDCVITESRKNNVKPEVVLAMMKAESNFNVTAVSPVGATGLMQLMPPTAKGIAKEIGISRYDLKDPCTSVKFGAHYIAWLHRYYKGRIELMVAGYNAGAGNVDIWIKRFHDKDIDYISEFTPFQETRDYIFRTKKYMIQYRSVYRTD